MFSLIVNVGTGRQRPSRLNGERNQCMENCFQPFAFLRAKLSWPRSHRWLAPRRRAEQRPLTKRTESGCEFAAANGVMQFGSCSRSDDGSSFIKSPELSGLPRRETVTELASDERMRARTPWNTPSSSAPMHRTQSGAAPPPEQVVRAYTFLFMHLYSQTIGGALFFFSFLLKIQVDTETSHPMVFFSLFAVSQRNVVPRGRDVHRPQNREAIEKERLKERDFGYVRHHPEVIDKPFITLTKAAGYIPGMQWLRFIRSCDSKLILSPTVCLLFIFILNVAMSRPRMRPA